MVRRFQKIDVFEPSIEDSVKILQGLKTCFEWHQKVKYTSEAGGPSATRGSRTDACPLAVRTDTHLPRPMTESIQVIVVLRYTRFVAERRGLALCYNPAARNPTMAAIPITTRTPVM